MSFLPYQVKEDLVEIILNLKELAIRMEQDEPKVITVNTQGPGVLTGADIITDVVWRS